MFLSLAYIGLKEPILKRKRKPAAGLTHARTSRIPFGESSKAILPILPIVTTYNKKINTINITNQLRADTTLDRRFRRGAL